MTSSSRRTVWLATSVATSPLAASWALLALASVRRQLRSSALADVAVARASWLPRASHPVVSWTLRIGRASCLERALVMQAWSAAHGRDLAVVIGVQQADGAFAAHAWLDGDGDGAERGDLPFAELLRLDRGP